MSEIPTAQIINFPPLQYPNPFFVRAHWVFNELYDLTEAQAENLKHLGRYKFEWETLVDQNEIMTIKIFEITPGKGERVSKIYKIPEHTSGREYLRSKNNPDPLVTTTWVEPIEGNDNSDIGRLLHEVEEALGFDSAEVYGIEHTFTRPHIMHPHVSETIRTMVGLPAQNIEQISAEQ